MNKVTRTMLHNTEVVIQASMFAHDHKLASVEENQIPVVLLPHIA